MLVLADLVRKGNEPAAARFLATFLPHVRAWDAELEAKMAFKYGAWPRSSFTVSQQLAAVLECQYQQLMLELVDWEPRPAKVAKFWE